MMDIHTATELAYKNGYAKGFADGKGEPISCGHEKGGEWISVTERVPTDEKQVLAYYDFAHGDGSFGMPFIGVLCYFAHDLNPHWQHESTGLRVTHWMPLPEPPKGE